MKADIIANDQGRFVVYTEIMFFICFLFYYPFDVDLKAK